MKKPPVLEEPPTKDFEKLRRAGTELCAMRVTRQAPNGRNSIIWPKRTNFQVQDLWNGGLEEALKAEAGGGSYTVQVFDNENTMQPLTPRWRVQLPGQARDLKSTPGYEPAPGFSVGPGAGAGPSFGPGAGVAPGTFVGGMRVPLNAQRLGMVPPVDAHGNISGGPPPGLMRNKALLDFDYQTQWQHVYDAEAQPGGMLDAGHQVTRDFAHRFEDRREKSLEEVARLQEKLAHEKETHVERMFALQQQANGGGLAAMLPMMLQMQQQQQQAAERAHQAAMQQQQQQMQMTLALLTQKPDKQGLDINAIAALAAAIVPVATAFVTQGGQRQDSALNAQLRQQEISQQAQQAQQAQLQQILLAQNGNKTSIVDLVAATAPILATIMQAKQGQAELALQRADMQQNNGMMTIKMLADVLAQQAEQQGNPELAEIIMRTAVESMPHLPGAVRAIRDAIKGDTPALPPPPTVAPRPPAQQRQQPPGASGAPADVRAYPKARDVSDEDSAEHWGHLHSINSSATVETAHVMESYLDRLGLHTIGWREAVFHAHHMSEPEVTADRFRNVIDAALEGGYMPTPIVEQLRADARKALETVVSFLPVARRNPEYAQAVVDAFMDRIRAEKEDLAREMQQQAQQPAHPPAAHVPTPASTPGPVIDTEGADITPPVASIARADDDEDDDSDSDDHDDVMQPGAEPPGDGSVAAVTAFMQERMQ